MVNGDSVSTSPTSTKHAQKIASLCQGSTSSWTPQFHGCLLRLQPDQHGPRRPRKNFIRHSARNLLLSSDAVWTQECKSYLSEVSESDVPETDRHNNGGVYRRHANKIHHSRAPHCSPLRGISNPAKVQHEVESSQVCLRGISRKIPGFHSQPLRNRGKSKQNKGCTRHAITIRNKGSPAFDRKDCCSKPIRIQGE